MEQDMDFDAPQWIDLEGIKNGHNEDAENNEWFEITHYNHESDEEHELIPLLTPEKTAERPTENNFVANLRPKKAIRGLVVQSRTNIIHRNHKNDSDDEPGLTAAEFHSFLEKCDGSFPTNTCFEIDPNDISKAVIAKREIDKKRKAPDALIADGFSKTATLRPTAQAAGRIVLKGTSTCAEIDASVQIHKQDISINHALRKKYRPIDTSLESRKEQECLNELKKLLDSHNSKVRPNRKK